LDEVIARESIRQTIANYTIAGDNRDAALFNTLWTDDALFDFSFPSLPSFRCEGIDQIRARTAAWKQLPDPDPTLRSATFIRHNLTTCQIELTGKDTASAKTYFIVVTDVGPDHAGNYTDQLARRGDRWLFAHRRVDLVWRSPDSCFPPVKR
jgi:ketosteroid isomerase-like protein